MKLKKVLLHNFRCFEKLEINFDPALTVIVAENGMGKTTILDAIAIGFGRLLTKIPTIKGALSKPSDLRILKGKKLAPFLRYELEVKGFGCGDSIRWSARRKRDSSPSTLSEMNKQLESIKAIGLKQIDAFANQLIDNYNNNEPFLMPVIAYYGTNRSIVGEVKRSSIKQFTRFESLSLEPSARFGMAFGWFRTMEDIERREQQQQRDFNYTLPELNAVRSAIESMLTGFRNPRTEIRPLRFVIDHLDSEGITRTYQISQLSDGYRLMLGLVMDLARRMAQANPDYNDFRDDDKKCPLDFPAIVMIDEIDLHLHPKWQQKVIPDLQRTFPNTQFIVTTHSPQLLTSVPAESIRIIENSQLYSAPPGTEGAEASRLLKRILGVDVRPPESKATKELNEYLALVDADQWNSERAVELRKILDERYQGEEPALLEADLLIENRQWELAQ